MNWQTKKILEDARKTLIETGVFSNEQVAVLLVMFDGIEKAMAKESGIVSSSINHTGGGHGFS